MSARLLTSSSAGRKAVLAATLCAALAGCTAHTPKGQVVAVVNNQEITFQDLNAEARAEGQQAPADPKILLQKVLARVLLAQAAKSQGLDRYPGYPSDLKRIEQTLLADKLVQSSLKPPTPPTPAQLAALISAHPNIFQNRARIQLTETPIPPGVDIKSIQDLDSMDTLVSRLKEFGSPVTPQTRTVDSADLAPALVQKLLSEPQGSLFILQAQGHAVAIVVQSTTPTPMPDDAAQALATRLFTQQETQKQIDDQVQRLRTAANIQYQSKFAPTANPTANNPKPNP